MVDAKGDVVAPAIVCGEGDEVEGVDDVTTEKLALKMGRGEGVV